MSIGGSGGRARHMSPYGTQFFLFRIHFHRKAPTLKVHAPSNGCTPALREILDPPLVSTIMKKGGGNNSEGCAKLDLFKSRYWLFHLHLSLSFSKIYNY